MITHITVEDAAKLISWLTNANETQALTYIREAADRGEIQATDALSTLKAENERLREKIEDARLEGYAKGLGEMSEENEKLRAELEQVKRENSQLKERLHGMEKS